MNQATASDIGKIITFHPYQKAWLDDRGRFKVGMFSRQSGKTFVACAEIVEDCIDAEIAGKRTRWVILSRGERQAREAMNENVKPMTRAFWELYRGILNGPAPDVIEREERVVRDDGTDAVYTALEVVYPGGSKITALPANPDTARGFSANVLFDEFAFHHDSKSIWGAAYPVISKGWKARVISTPNGKANKFYDLMTEEPSIWSRHEVDIYSAVEQGLDRNIEELRAGLNDNDLWEQEFELKWRDEATAWLDYDLIAACETEGYGRLRSITYTGKEITECIEVGQALGPPRGPTYVGMDIARRKDLTCIWQSELIGDVLYPREIILMCRAPFRAQHDELKRLRDRDQPNHFLIDQTGMGEPFVESAIEYLGEMRCQGVLFTPANRFTLATTLRDNMEDRKFRIPTGRRDIKEDLHSITKAVSNTGAIRLVHTGESDGHGDRFWAAALCAHACHNPFPLYEYQGSSSNTAADDPHRSPMATPDDGDPLQRGRRMPARGCW